VLLLHHIRYLFQRNDSISTDPFVSRSQKRPPDLIKIPGMQLAGVFGEAVAGMSKADAAHQQLVIDDAKGATSMR
jgi:hypothetical protein